MINRLPWKKKLRTSAANNLKKINEIIDYINTSDISPVMLSDNASGRSVITGHSSSLKSLVIEGESVQDGTPTPDAPVEVRTVRSNNLWPEDSIDLVIGDGVAPIDLQGNVLASLPDGTRDRLLVDSAGHVVIEKNTGKISLKVADMDNTDETPGWKSSGIRDIIGAGINTTFSSNALSNIYNGTSIKFGVNTNGYNDILFLPTRIYGMTQTEWKTRYPDLVIELIFALPTPQTIDLGYITPPTITEGDAISVSASIVPVIDVAWWIYEDITTIIDDLKAYVDYKTESEG